MIELIETTFSELKIGDQYVGIPKEDEWGGWKSKFTPDLAAYLKHGNQEDGS